MNLLLSQPILCAVIAAGFIWLMTSLGSAAVFFFRSFSPSLHTVILGFTSGIMLAACFWSLLSPAVELSRQRGEIPWLVATAGILSGVALLCLTQRLAEKIKNTPEHNPSFLLWLSVTLHNIPEGLAVGVAFGTLNASSDSAAFAAAFSVAVGIGIQNIPEGTAVSLPLRKHGHSRTKSFLWGVLSGAVEPIAAVTGAVLVVFSSAVLPFALSLAAGAMIYVVLQELIPEAARQSSAGSPQCMISATLGFVLMMILDIALG